MLKIKYSNKEQTLLEIDDGVKCYIDADNIENTRFKAKYKKFLENGGVIEPYQTSEEELISLKKDRKSKLKEVKQKALTRPIGINGKLFFSSEEDYLSYKLDYEAGLDAGLTQGEVLCIGSDNKPTKTLVTKEELEEYFKRFRARKYKITMYYGELVEQIDKATSLEEVKKIEWVYPKNYAK